MEPEQIVMLLNKIYSVYDRICLEERAFKVETCVVVCDL